MVIFSVRGKNYGGGVYGLINVNGMYWGFDVVEGVVNGEGFGFKIYCIVGVLGSVSGVDIKIDWFIGIVELEIE